MTQEIPDPSTLTNAELVEAVIKDCFEAGKYDTPGEPEITLDLKNELMRRLCSPAPAAKVRFPEGSPNDVAATHYIELITFIEAFFQTPKMLSASDVSKMAGHIIPLFDYIDTLTPPEGDKLRSLVFTNKGEIRVELQVIEGEISLVVYNRRDELLLGMTIPIEASRQMATAVLSHQTLEEIPLEKRN
jgi:hypothetical protein